MWVIVVEIPALFRSLYFCGFGSTEINEPKLNVYLCCGWQLWTMPSWLETAGEFTHNIPSEVASSFIRGFLGCSSTNSNHQITITSNNTQIIHPTHTVSHTLVKHWLHFPKNAEYNTLLCGKNIAGIPSRSLSPSSTSSSVRLWKAFMSLLETDFLLPRRDVSLPRCQVCDRYVQVTKDPLFDVIKLKTWTRQKLRILVTCPSSASMLELRKFLLESRNLSVVEAKYWLQPTYIQCIVSTVWSECKDKYIIYKKSRYFSQDCHYMLNMSHLRETCLCEHKNLNHKGHCIAAISRFIPPCKVQCSSKLGHFW